MRRRRRRGGLLVPSLCLLGLALVLPSTTPRPASLKHHQDPEAVAAAALRKASSEKKSGFAAVVESATKAAAAAAGEDGLSQGEDSTFMSSVVEDSGASRTAAVDVSANGDGTKTVAAEADATVSRFQDQARAVAVVGEGARLMVAGTVDGQVHALDPATGDVRWSFSTGEPLVKSYQRSLGALDEKRWLIPTLDGSMLVHTAQGLRRPPFNARALVEQTPFLDPGGTFYTGSKNSRIWGVDAHTGEVRQVLSGETADSLESDLKLLAASGSDGELIWIGRNDYTVRAFDVPTGQEQWNLTIGEFVSLEGLYAAARDGGSANGAGGDGGSSVGSGTSGGTTARSGSRPEPTPSLVAAPDGSLRLISAGKNPNSVGSGSGSSSRQKHSRGKGSGSRSHTSVWNAPLPTHVASVFQVSLEEGSASTYLPLQRLPLSQSAADGARGGSGGSAGNAAIGMLENSQLYAVALDELRYSDGDDGAGGESAGGGRNAGGGGVSRATKNRAGEGNKVTHGGRASATQPLLPHGGGDWQRGEADSADHGGGEGGGGGHGRSAALVQSLSQKGSLHGGSLRSCQPGHANFPECLSGVHPVSHIGEQEQSRLALGIDGTPVAGAGARDNRGVRASTGYMSRLPPLASNRHGGDNTGGGLAGIIAAGFGIGGGEGAGDGGGGYLKSSTHVPSPLEALISWMSRMWSFVSIGILAVVVAILIDQRRASRFLKRVGLSGYPLYANGDRRRVEYDPTADSGFSGTSDGSMSGGGIMAGAGSALSTVGVNKGELRVGCLTVSDRVLGYGSHGTVVYRGLLEGRPVAVKRMLTDFHARADREISLLIESDGHPNVVRYFVREEAGEFVYLALQLCQLSLHNAMAQIHGAMAQARRQVDIARSGKSLSPRVGLGRALSRDDVSAPAELRAALLQVSQGVEHLHSLRIVHRDLKPHNILLAAIERKGPGLGVRKGISGTMDSDATAEGEGGGQGEEGQESVTRKLSKMSDIASFVLKISDMGLGKQLLNGQSSFGMSSYGRTPGAGQGGGGGDALARARASNTQASSSAGGHVGSIGWQAPEVIADRVSFEGGQGPSVTPSWAAAGGASSVGGSVEGGRVGSGSSSSRRTQAVDVFSLGCIFHHCIVPGSHPFGQWYEREANIIQDKASHLSELAHVPDAHDLVSLMTAREPDLRPSAGEVCKHPFFWNDEKRLSFLLEFSDRLEQDSVQSSLLVMIEAGADSVVGRSWDVRLDPELTEDAGRYRKYDFSSVRDLLRVVRNKRHHFHELPERVQALMSPLPGGFLRYIEERFPQLLMHCAKVTGALLSGERIFTEYLVHFSRPHPPSSIINSSTRPANVPSAAEHNAQATLPPTPGSFSDASPSTLGATVPVGGGAAAIARGVSSAPSSPSFTDGKKSLDRPSAGTSPTLSSTSGASTAAPLSPLPTPPGLPPEGSDEDVKKARARESGGEPVRQIEANGNAKLFGEGVEAGVQTAVAAAPPGSGTTSGTVGVVPTRSSASTTASGMPGRVTDQNGPRGEGPLTDVLLWNESAVAKSMGCRGWWRHQDHWQRRLDVTKQRPRGAHLNKALQDPKYRTRLCSHWENSKGTLCPMRRRGAGKCDFAHGGLELRVRANKRDRWGRHTGPDGGSANLDASGGEDTLGAARSIGRIRMENGTRDGVGSAAVSGAGGGGGSNFAGGGSSGGTGGGSGAPRPGNKRAKGGGASQASDGPAGNWQGRGRGGSGGNGVGVGPPGSGDLQAVGANGTATDHRAFASSRSPTRVPQGDASTEFGPNRSGAIASRPNGVSMLAREPATDLHGGGYSRAPGVLPPASMASDTAEFRDPRDVLATTNGIGNYAGVDVVNFAGENHSDDRSRFHIERNPAAMSPGRAMTGSNGIASAEIPNGNTSDRRP